MGIIDSIIGAESGGDASARNPNSSAGGAGQFIDSTWLDMLAKHRPDLTGSPDELLALKNDPKLSAEMTGAYAADNGVVLGKAGLPVTPGTTYLAHFAGPQGAIGLLNADPSAPAASILGASAVRSNPFLAKMTAGDVAAWADKKMGVSAPAPMSIAGPQQAPQSAPQAPAPQRPAPQQVAPQAAAAGPAVDLNALAAVPQMKLANLLPPRPNPFGLRAPFSLGG